MVSICGCPLLNLCFFVIHLSYCYSYRVYHGFRGTDNSFGSHPSGGLPVHSGRSDAGLAGPQSFSLFQPGRMRTGGEEARFVIGRDFQEALRLQTSSISKAETKSPTRNTPLLPTTTQFLIPNASAETRSTLLDSVPASRSGPCFFLPGQNATEADTNTIPYFPSRTQSTGGAEAPPGLPSRDAAAISSEGSFGSPVVTTEQVPSDSRGMTPHVATKVSSKDASEVHAGPPTEPPLEAAAKALPNVFPTCVTYVPQPSCETAVLPQRSEDLRPGHQALQSIMRSLKAIIAEASQSRREGHPLPIASSDVASTQPAASSNDLSTTTTTTLFNSLPVPNRLPDPGFAAAMSVSESKKGVLYGFDLLQSLAYDTFSVNELMLLCVCESDTTQGLGLIQSVILSGFDQVLDHRFFNHLWNGAAQRQEIVVDTSLGHNSVTSAQAAEFVSVPGPVDKSCNTLLHLAVLSENPLMVTKLLARLHEGGGFGRNKAASAVYSLFTSQNLDGLTPLQLASSKVTTSVRPGIRAVLKKWFLILNTFRRYQKYTFQDD